ncbi:hypothetical protein ACQ4PT_031458 [Festuca glaucescens]
MEAFDKYGHAKQRVQEELDFLDSAKDVAVTEGLNLTYTQISKINKIVEEVGLGLGVVFVHRINDSDIAKNMLHIPKLAARNLNIPYNGTAILEVHEDDHNEYEEAEYYTSLDGRVRFDSGWKTFAEDNGLGPGDVVVMLFDMIDDMVHINISEVA